MISRSSLYSILTAFPVLAVVILLLIMVRPVFFPDTQAASAHPRAASGTEWRPVGLAGTIVHQVVVERRGPGTMLVAAHGGIYSRRPDGRWRRLLNSEEIWGIDVLPSARTIIAADNNGTVDRTTDAGRRWRKIAVAAGGVYAVSVNPGNPRHMLAGAAGGLYQSLDGGLHWQRRLATPQSAGSAFAWEPGSSRIVFAGVVAGGTGGSTDVYISRDDGKTWKIFGRGLNSLAGIMSLAVVGSSGVYAGTMGNAVWTAPVRSGAWHKAADGMPPRGDHVSGIAILHRRGLLYAATLGYGVFRTSDGGKSWVNVSRGLSPAHGATTVLGLLYDSHNRTLLAATADGVFQLSAP